MMFHILNISVFILLNDWWMVHMLCLWVFVIVISSLLLYFALNFAETLISIHAGVHDLESLYYIDCDWAQITTN